MNKAARSTLIVSTKSLRRRQWAEKRFRWYGASTTFAVLAVLCLLLSGIILKGYPAFTKTKIDLDIYFDPQIVQFDPKQPTLSLRSSNLRLLILTALQAKIFTGDDPDKVRQALNLISPGATTALFHMVLNNPSILGETHKLSILASDDVDQFLKHSKLDAQRLSGQQITWLTELAEQNLLKSRFNGSLLVEGDSREPEQAGIGSAIIGSLFIMILTLLLAFPLSIATAVYLEEFAPKNALTRFIDLNISNLAAVPSIIFGLLALAIFLNTFHLPRSSSLVAGMTLAMMTMPTIVISSRAALQTVPKSIREAAAGLGASRIQIVFQHVLPLAMPGIITGTILGMARALGESASLLMVGMVAFIVDVPKSPLDPATALPVQIFNWARNPEQGFVENTAAAILILLLILAVMNTSAIILRKRFEYRW